MSYEHTKDGEPVTIGVWQATFPASKCVIVYENDVLLFDANSNPDEWSRMKVDGGIRWTIGGAK